MTEIESEMRRGAAIAAPRTNAENVTENVTESKKAAQGAAHQRRSRGSGMRDMTQGDPLKLILGFALPMLLGTLFQQLYSMADTVVVGRFLGVQALAAVGSTGAVNFMVNGFVIGASAGFAIPVSQRFGAGDHVNMRRFVANIIWMGLLFAAVLTVLVALFTRQVLVLTRTPEELLDQAYAYIFIIFLGIPVTFLYNTTASVIRALGDAKTPVYFLVLASVVNIVLDILFIAGFGFGVNGPAIATLISQGVSGILCLLHMRRNYPILRFRKGEMSFSGQQCAVLCSMAVPMGLQYSITAIGAVILQTSVNMLGTTAVAAMTTGQKIGIFFSSVYDALGAAMATWSGQNLGAGKIDRLVKGVWTATKIGWVYWIFAFAVLFFFGGKLPLLFIDSSNTQVITWAHHFLIANSLCYCLLTIVNVWRFAIQGMGYSMFAICSGVLEMAARTIVAFTAVPALGFHGVCLASPLAWVFAVSFLIPAFYHCVKKVRQMLGREAKTSRDAKAAEDKGSTRQTRPSRGHRPLQGALQQR